MPGRIESEKEYKSIWRDVAFGAVLLSSLITVQAYGWGFARGEGNGYIQGYKEGREEGHSKGYDLGLDIGGQIEEIKRRRSALSADRARSRD